MESNQNIKWNCDVTPPDRDILDFDDDTLRGEVFILTSHQVKTKEIITVMEVWIPS